MEASADDAEPPAEAEEPGVGGKRELVVHVGKWMCLTRFAREMPLAPPAFSIHLRKHVSGARVVGVRQHAFDRVVELDLEKKEGSFTLLIELFHDGNVILVKDGRIVTPLLQPGWATREVRPGAEFRPPPERFNPEIATEAEYLSKFRAPSSDAVRTLPGAQPRRPVRGGGLRARPHREERARRGRSGRGSEAASRVPPIAPIVVKAKGGDVPERTLEEPGASGGTVVLQRDLLR